MLRYIVNKAALTADVATLTLESADGLHAGWAVTVAGVGHPYDGNNLTLLTVTAATATTPATVTYSQHHVNIAETAVYGQMTVPVTWADTTDVTDFLAFDPVDAGDVAWLDSCVKAANSWAYDQRKIYGYQDLPNVAPDVRAVQAVSLLAGSWYRERGSVDSFPSFQDTAGTGLPTGGTLPNVRRLLGIAKARAF